MKLGRVYGIGAHLPQPHSMTSFSSDLMLEEGDVLRFIDRSRQNSVVDAFLDEFWGRRVEHREKWA